MRSGRGGGGEREGEVVIILAGVFTRWDVVGERVRRNFSAAVPALFLRLHVNLPLVLVGSCTALCS